MNTKEIVRSFISRELLQGKGVDLINDNEHLIDNGLIDSLGIMTMLSYLEEEFSLQIPNDELIPENFSSISSISTLVDRLKNR